ncbi:hypothetical protein FNW02_15715 [Komarekiella sp. 'clone 1']|uniref:Uncharacterized protein n=1 Tax=Komarekiella delphini-convector SJRDD-AB1 TaxID=2593771 RepID=A0AA40VRI7_9NOST|nr:hypothetical protein [Komarekiella delphini-convector SJRDD-AB1]
MGIRDWGLGLKIRKEFSLHPVISHQLSVISHQSSVINPQSPVPSPQSQRLPPIIPVFVKNRRIGESSGIAILLQQPFEGF